MTDERNERGPQRLSPAQIQYLSFEGGGGKGLAYFGALAALAEVGVLKKEKPKHGNLKTDYVLSDQIIGISGASAGAITATLLGSGLGIRRLFQMMTDQKALHKFYDPATMDVDLDPVAKPYTPHKIRINHNGMKLLSARKRLRVNPHKQLWSGFPFAVIRQILHAIVNAPPTSPSSFGPKYAAKKIISEIIKPKYLSDLVNYIGYNFYKDNKNKYDMLETPIFEVLLTNLSPYLLNLKEDYGAFSGSFARTYLAMCMAEGATKSMYVNYSEEDNNTNHVVDEDLTELSFNDYSLHMIELKLTGTNVTTGESRYFSSATTPDFKVADALRISMSFPVAYKPIILKEEMIDKPKDWSDMSNYAGVWVDGGVLNNNPIHAFDQKQGQINSGMLGLRLGVATKNNITDFKSFTVALVSSILGLSERGQVRTPQQEAQTISLPVRHLSTLDFVPDSASRDKDMVTAAKTVLEYFDSDADPENVVKNKLGLQTLDT